jgi:4-amino-4-deoxy-L-arabinose transferase-like glycosyltransferase
VSEQRRWPWALLTVAALVWIAIVVAVYYVSHKPFTASHLVALCDAVTGLAGAVLVIALATGIGLLLVQWVDLAPPERPIWAAAVGLGVVSLVGLGLGAVGLLQPWLLWVLTVAGLGVTGQRLRRALWAAWADLTWRPQAQFEILLAGYCGTMLALALVWALTPPTAWDGLVYHLTGPKLYLATGWISHPLDLPYLGFPQLVEMLFAWGIGLTGERAAAPIHWFYGLLAALSLVTAGRRWLGGAVGWLAAAVLLSAPSIVLLAGWPYVDLALLLYATLAFLALLRFCDGGSQTGRWLVLSGVFAGLALSTKYTALALLPALGLALLLVQAFNPESRIWNSTFAVRNALLLGGVALVTWSPWLLKNLLLTGNLTYPFFFGGIYWDNWRAWWYDRPGTGLAYTAPWKLFTAPWDATVRGVEGSAGYSATIGPLFLALLPLLFLVWRRLAPARQRWLRAALAFCGALYGFWLWGMARSALLLQTRLLFPAFGLLALMVGAAVEGLRALRRRPLDLGWLARAVVVWVLALTLVAAFFSTAQERPLGVLLGFESREEFLTRRLGWYLPAVEHINQELPPDAVVVFLWEPRSYHCRVQCWPDTLLDRFLHATHLYGYDAEAIAAAWRAEGVTHVLLYRQGYEVVREAGFDPLTEADVTTLEELRRHHLQDVQAFGGSYVLYGLR